MELKSLVNYLNSHKHLKLLPLLCLMIFGTYSIVFKPNGSPVVSDSTAVASVSENMIHLIYENSLESECSIDEASCLAAIRERVVQIKTANSIGTGFIIESSEDYYTVMTASHVVRTGNGYKSAITDDLFVYHEKTNLFISAINACAFFQNAYADIAILTFNNFDKRIFPPIQEGYGRRGDKVFVVDNKYLEKRSWIYIISGFDNSKNEIFLSDSSEPGMSGSPMITADGKLNGILTASYVHRHGTIGTFKFADISYLGMKYLIEKESYFAPYICRQF